MIFKVLWLSGGRFQSTRVLREIEEKKSWKN